MKSPAIPALALVLSAVLPAAAGEQLPNLHGVPASERTVLPLEKTWPEKPGEAALCMWKGDKTAAITYGIDDNCAMNIDWWLREAGSRGIRMTWFLITGNIDGSDRPALNGKWADWRRAREAGHALESHSMTHLSGAENPETWKGIDWEYGESLRLICENIPGWTATCLAYPGGKNSGNNSEEVAARHVIAARGGRGTPNPAQGIDYLSTCAMSRHNIGDDPKAPWSDVNRLFGPAERNNAYRGWAILFWHFIKEDDESVVATARKSLDFYVGHKDELWMGTFAEVARYGQERETATLASAGDAKDGFEITLTDRMADDRFDEPLTVKVRLPDDWTGVAAEQAGSPIPAQVIEHEGARFALVDVIPDRGPAKLRVLRQ